MVVCAPGRDELFGLSLCAGYAGLDLGITIAEPRYRTVCYVEREAHAAATLVARMADSALDSAPIWDDLKSFDGRPWRGRVHILSAGYPCQPFTVSGLRRGAADPRHLWPDVSRIIDEARPRAVFLENVEGHVDLGLAEVASDIARLGYRAKAGLFSAAEAGARHRRHRLFIMAYSDSVGRGALPRPGDRQRHHALGQIARTDVGVGGPGPAAKCRQDMDRDLADINGGGLEADDRAPLFAPGPGELAAWDRLVGREAGAEPAILRDDDGLADRLDRTRGVGNGVCSMAAALAWRTLGAQFAREGWQL
ncbi:DNA cytosine methyltransferase [Sphingopyxis sp.]|uniref:DNA cytosine methyltransferase n=1 Tax=Sphingopyxis sp. TaxID=1908224 RepID=UPI003D80B40A